MNPTATLPLPAKKLIGTPTSGHVLSIWRGEQHGQVDGPMPTRTNTMATGQPDGDLPPPLLDTPAAAKMLGVSARTVFTLKKTGELRAIRVGKRLIKFSLDEIERYMRQQQASDPSP